MSTILNVFCDNMAAVIARICLVLILAVYSSYGGGCNFPATWTGGWFQSGMPGLIYINATNIAGKGECSELDTNDKFIVHDRNEDCFRCMVIHEKHKYVLQYKETFCLPRDSLPTLCDGITGDAALYSMFKKEPFPTPVQCPFRPAPFTFTYSRGSDDCTNPPSRAESCTDDSRLLLRYMACPDQPGTESNVEELICLATWKEGSTRYLVGLISQVQRRNTIQTDEDMFRCFVYRGQHVEKVVTYDIAQSGDATCNGLTSPVDGSRTMKLTNSDDEHNRCHFPSWIVEHHKWYSLDHTHEYHFTTKNATLKINKGNTLEEKRLVCHSILQQKDKQLVTLVAHLTRGCESGHVCVKLYRREGNVLEMQLGKSLYETPQDACADERFTPHVTLVATALFPVRCPILGRFTIVDSVPDRRRRRQPPMQLDEAESADGSERAVECVEGQFDSASVGCHHQRDTIEFHSACSTAVYNCYGSWEEDGLGLVVAGPQARSPPHAHALCFLYTTYVKNDSFGTPIQYLSMSLLGRACDRTVLPGVAGDKAYNLTLNGTCEQSSKYNSVASRLAPAVVAIVVVALLVAS